MGTADGMTPPAPDAGRAETGLPGKVRLRARGLMRDPATSIAKER